MVIIPFTSKLLSELFFLTVFTICDLVHFASNDFIENCVCASMFSSTIQNGEHFII